MNINIQGFGTFLSASVFSLLLLLSPCKVKNLIQAELGIPITIASNKSKSTIANSNCNVLELEDAQIAVSSNSSKHPSLSVAKTERFSFSKIAENNIITNYFKTSSILVFSVPLFILYQKIKVHL